LFGFVSFFVSNSLPRNKKIGIIYGCEFANGYSFADITSRVIAQIPENVKVTIIENKGDFTKVRYRVYEDKRHQRIKEKVAWVETSKVKEIEDVKSPIKNKDEKWVGLVIATPAADVFRKVTGENKVTVTDIKITSGELVNVKKCKKFDGKKYCKIKYTLDQIYEPEVAGEEKVIPPYVHEAMKKNKKECVNALLDKEKNMKDNNGKTALMFAAEKGKVECVKVLA